MVTKNKVWRPAKTFKAKPKENIIRSRWRPRKHIEKSQKFPQLEDIKKIPISFVANNIRKNSKVDNMALWLLVFSILLFIFSMLFKSRNIDTTQITQSNNNPTPIVKEETVNNTETIKQTTNTIQTNTWTQTPTQETIENDTKDLSIQAQLISDFYQNINAKNFTNLNNLIDIPLKQSNSYKTYYNSVRLTNFLNSISNNTIYITNIKEIPNTWWKAKKYQYILKYKLKTDNTLFSEERNASVVYKNDKNLIWSIMCVNKWCSLTPFFNPKKY